MFRVLKKFQLVFITLVFIFVLAGCDFGSDDPNVGGDDQ